MNKIYSLLKTMGGKDLHSYKPIIYQNFFSKEVGADGSFVTGTKLLIDLITKSCWLALDLESALKVESSYILVHQTGLADSTIT